MSGLWTYGRRPSCITRYRHGGYNAIYPLAPDDVFEGVAEIQRQERAEKILQEEALKEANQQSQHGLTNRAAEIRGEKRLASLGGGRVSTHRTESNVIAFPSAAAGQTVSGQNTSNGTRRKSGATTRNRQAGPPKPRD